MAHYLPFAFPVHQRHVAVDRVLHFYEFSLAEVDRYVYYLSIYLDLREYVGLERVPAVGKTDKFPYYLSPGHQLAHIMLIPEYANTISDYALSIDKVYDKSDNLWKIDDKSK
jgi:hypothetical protein